MDRITISHLLPRVFVGMENSDKIRSSQIWEEPSFVFERGCRLCVQAESGSGKSSLLSYIFGTRTDYRGQILFDGRDVRSLSVSDWCDIRTRSIAMLPQDMGLFPELTVEQNISLKNNRTHHKTESQILDMLERLGIANKYHVRTGMLSIGQMQRVALIRAVCQPFDFIFLDEPVSHLDERNNRIVAQIITEEATAQGAGVIATSVGNHLLMDHSQSVLL